MKEKSYMAYTPDYVESLREGQVFVFGSDLVGCHSGGAAAMAMQRFGAVWGQAEGPQGQCYAIPVDIRGEEVGSVSSYMKRHIGKFLDFAKAHKELFFLVTRIGCGAAGFDDEFIAPFFKEAVGMRNVSLPKSFMTILGRETEAKKGDGTQRVFNLIILDESGSMEAIEKQAVSGMNETFQTIVRAQMEHREQQHFISLVTFNSLRIRTVMDCVAVDPSKKLKWSDYSPNYGTPLFDAMGRSLTELRHRVADNDVVLVTIITDGMENSSRKFSGHAIKRLVAKLRTKGWVFVYIGTNQDVDAMADDMGIRSRMHYDYSEKGASDMFEEESISRKMLYSRLALKGSEFLKKADYDFFNGDDGDENPSEGNEGLNAQTENETTSAEEEGLKEERGIWKRIKNSLKGRK